MEEIDNLKKEMLKEVNKQRERAKEKSEPIPQNSFGRFGHGMQLGVPNGSSMSSMRIFNISPEIGISVMDKQRESLEKELCELETIAKLELTRETDL